MKFQKSELKTPVFIINLLFRKPSVSCQVLGQSLNYPATYAMVVAGVSALMLNPKPHL
jgi:hypothetical protein